MDKELLNYTFVYKGWEEAFQEELNKPNPNEENLKQLKLVIVINKMLFDNLSMQEATKELNMTEKELDKKILSTLLYIILILNTSLLI